MIDVKQAAKTALDYFLALPLKHNNISGLELEEVELAEDSKYWLITLGYHHTSPLAAGKLAEVLGPPKPPTYYKVFKINAESGEVESMKIRQVG